jgi:hypothetical protein
LFFAVGHGVKPACFNAQVLEVSTGSVSAFLTQAHVVLGGTTIIAMALDGDGQFSALLEAFRIAIQNSPSSGSEVVSIEIEIDGGQGTHAFAILTGQAFPTVIIALAIACDNATMAFAFFVGIATVFIGFAFPLAFVLAADHPGFVSASAIGIDFTFMNTGLVFTERLVFRTIAILVAFHATVFRAMRPIGRTIWIFTTFFAIAHAAFLLYVARRNVISLDAMAIFLAFRKIRFWATCQHQRKRKQTNRSEYQSYCTDYLHLFSLQVLHPLIKAKDNPSP